MSAGFSTIIVSVLVAVAAVGLLGLVLAFSTKGGLRAIGIVLSAVVGVFLLLGLGAGFFLGAPSHVSTTVPPTPIASPTVRTVSANSSAEGVAIRGEAIRIIVNYNRIPQTQNEPLRDKLTPIVTSQFQPFAGPVGRSRTSNTVGDETSGNLMFTFEPGEGDDWDAAFAAAQAVIKEVKAEAANMGLESNLIIRLTNANNVEFGATVPSTPEPAEPTPAEPTVPQ